MAKSKSPITVEQLPQLSGHQRMVVEAIGMLESGLSQLQALPRATQDLAWAQLREDWKEGRHPWSSLVTTLQKVLSE